MFMPTSKDTIINPALFLLGHYFGDGSNLTKNGGGVRFLRDYTVEMEWVGLLCNMVKNFLQDSVRIITRKAKRWHYVEMTGRHIPQFFVDLATSDEEKRRLGKESRTRRKQNSLML